MAFEENVGQSAEDVRFIARGGASSVHLEQNAAVFWVAASAPPASARAGLGRPATQAPTRLRMTLAHARAASELVGEQVLEGRANYLIGNDPARWKRDVRRYEQVRMRGAYDGIDVVFHGGEGHALEYDFVVQRGADPGKIELGFEDAERVVVGASGELRIELGAETVTMKAPVSYQIVGTERRAVASAYVVRDRHARLELGAYDPELELVVDPLIQFSTFLGGTGGERVTCLARDTAGNLYLSGSTTSANFPKQGALDAGGALRGDVDAFVTKLNPSGSSVLYSTYLGGSSDEYMTDVFAGFITGARTCAVDAQGRLYVSTTTQSLDFPTTPGAFARTLQNVDVTLSRLNAAGNGLEFSTFLGGANNDYWASIALEPSGHVWMAGHTHSADFPVQSAVQPTKSNADIDNPDVFVTRVTPDGSALTFSTFLGGLGRDYPFDIALDAQNSAYVVGATVSPAFPTTPGAFQPVYGGSSGSAISQGDAFLTKFKLAPDGAATVDFSTFLGGAADEIGQAVAIGTDGSIYLGGVTNSLDFPGQTGRPGAVSDDFDGFVMKLDPLGKTRRYSRLFGQDKLDGVYDIAVNAAGNLFIAGTGTLGPTTVNGCGRPGDKGILGMLKADGSAWEYLTPFGQFNTQIVVDGQDNAYVAGWGGAEAAPVVGNVAQPTYGGGASDAYLVKLARLPNSITECAACTGDFNGLGARPCPANAQKCLVTGECGFTGRCNTDSECGGVTSGRVCATNCVDGCRGQGGNGCPPGLECSSTTTVAGRCVPPADAGANPDSAAPPDGAAPVGDGAPGQPPSSPGAGGVDPGGSLQGGGCACTTTRNAPADATTLLALAGLAALFVRRTRAARRA